MIVLITYSFLNKYVKIYDFEILKNYQIMSNPVFIIVNIVLIIALLFIIIAGKYLKLNSILLFIGYFMTSFVFYGYWSDGIFN